MDRRVDVRHFVHRRSCDISSSNMAAYERWPRVSGRGTKYTVPRCAEWGESLCSAVAANPPTAPGSTQSGLACILRSLRLCAPGG